MILQGVSISDCFDTLSAQLPDSMLLADGVWIALAFVTTQEGSSVVLQHAQTMETMQLDRFIDAATPTRIVRHEPHLSVQ